ncbi:MAG: hypothetical protein OXG35_21415 [Acidobacteria bacterium]|nr:hypothetical protein [Acidobacteriota bacterium]
MRTIADAMRQGSGGQLSGRRWRSMLANVRLTTCGILDPDADILVLRAIRATADETSTALAEVATANAAPGPPRTRQGLQPHPPGGRWTSAGRGTPTPRGNPQATLKTERAYRRANELPAVDEPAPGTPTPDEPDS